MSLDVVGHFYDAETGANSVWQLDAHGQAVEPFQYDVASGWVGTQFDRINDLLLGEYECTACHMRFHSWHGVEDHWWDEDE